MAFLQSPRPFAQTFLKVNEMIHNIEALEETYQDFIIPENAAFREFNLEIEGADGGWIEYTYLDRFGTNRTQRVNGGEGATISATYTIGRNMGQIPPGSTLRFIIGNRGSWAKFDLLSHGGYGTGGGGARHPADRGDADPDGGRRRGRGWC